MLRGKKVLAIIPVRAGSQGIPNKNLYELKGMSLLERTIRLASNCSEVDDVIVSTDDTRMHEIAQSYGVASKTLRPAELSTSTASTIDVILHEADLNDVGDVFVILLQVTTPLRTLEDLSQVIALMQNNDDADSVVSLKLHDAPHPDKVQHLVDGKVRSYLNKESMVARQLLPDVYALNGAFYIAHLEHLKKQRSFFAENTLPYIMPEEKSINLDGPLDLLLLEAMLEKELVDVEDLPASGV